MAAEKSLKVAKSHVGRFASVVVVPRKSVPISGGFTKPFLFSLLLFSWLSVCGSTRVYVSGLGGQALGRLRCFSWFSRLRSSETARSLVWAAEHL